MSDLKTELELARALFGPQSSGGLGVRRVTATATSGSSDGTVSVDVGGEVVEVPVIGAVSTGDEVQLLVDNGAPIAVAATGWGDQLQDEVDTASAIASATNQHFFADTSGVHVTEQEGDATTGPNVLLNSQGQLFRNGSSVLASFSPSGIDFYSGWNLPTASYTSTGIKLGNVYYPSILNLGSDGMTVSTSQGIIAKIDDEDAADNVTVLASNETVAAGATYPPLIGTVGDWVPGQRINAYSVVGGERQPLPSGVELHTNVVEVGTVLRYSWWVTNSTSAAVVIDVERVVPGDGFRYGKGPFCVKFEDGSVTGGTYNGVNVEELAATVAAMAPTVETIGNWTVEKRADGIIEATRTITGSLAVTSSYAGRYISALQSTSLPSGLFTAIDWAGVEVAYSPGLWDAHLTTVSTSTVNYYIACNASTTANITRRIYVRGR